MRIELDENLPGELAEDLRRSRHDVDTVVDEGLAGKEDQTVAEAAAAEERVLFTLDRGLGDVRRYPPSAFYGIAVFRIAPKGRLAVRLAVNRSIARIASLGDLRGCLIVVSGGSIRVRR